LLVLLVLHVRRDAHRREREVLGPEPQRVIVLSARDTDARLRRRLSLAERLARLSPAAWSAPFEAALLLVEREDYLRVEVKFERPDVGELDFPFEDFALEPEPHEKFAPEKTPVPDAIDEVCGHAVILS